MLFHKQQTQQKWDINIHGKEQGQRQENILIDPRGNASVTFRWEEL